MSDTATKDKYDEAIEYLTQNPDNIQKSWAKPYSVQYVPDELINFNPIAGQLFKYLGPNDSVADHGFGCATQIKKAGVFNSQCFDEELKKKILADDRVPSRPDDITVESLQVFAEYQREADKLRATTLQT